MKLVLKILALPVLFVVKVICILGNLLTNVVSYVIGLLLLVIGGSAIYCIVKALWQSLLILVAVPAYSCGSWNCDNSSGVLARLGCYESREYWRKSGSIYQVIR